MLVSLQTKQTFTRQQQTDKPKTITTLYAKKNQRQLQLQMTLQKLTNSEKHLLENQPI